MPGDALMIRDHPVIAEAAKMLRQIPADEASSAAEWLREMAADEAVPADRRQTCARLSTVLAAMACGIDPHEALKRIADAGGGRN